MLDFGEVAAMVDVSDSIPACPTPGFLEHPAMQFSEIDFIQRVSALDDPGTEGPALGGKDVLSFPLVQFPPRREVWNQLRGIVGVERCIPGSTVEIGDGAHLRSRRLVSC